MIELPETDLETEARALDLQDPELMMKSEMQATAQDGRWREELRKRKKFSNKVPSMCSPERVLKASQSRMQRLSRHSVFSDSSEFLADEAATWKPPLQSGLKRGQRFDPGVSESGNRLAEALEKIGAPGIAENFRSTRF